MQKPPLSQPVRSRFNRNLGGAYNGVICHDPKYIKTLGYFPDEVFAYWRQSFVFLGQGAAHWRNCSIIMRSRTASTIQGRYRLTDALDSDDKKRTLNTFANMLRPPARFGVMVRPLGERRRENFIHSTAMGVLDHTRVEKRRKSKLAERD
jgi:hypothetical protein